MKSEKEVVFTIWVTFGCCWIVPPLSYFQTIPKNKDAYEHIDIERNIVVEAQNHENPNDFPRI